MASEHRSSTHCYVSIISDEGAILSTLLYWAAAAAVWAARRGAGGQGVSVGSPGPAVPMRSEVIARSSPGEEVSSLWELPHQSVYRKCRRRAGGEAGERNR